MSANQANLSAKFILVPETEPIAVFSLVLSTLTSILSDK